MPLCTQSLQSTHPVAAAPSDIVEITNNGTIVEVNWTPPSPLGPVTGYRIYYDGNGSSNGSADGEDSSSGYVNVTGGSTRSHILTSLSSSVSYTLSIVAFSTFLPSEVVYARYRVEIGTNACIMFCLNLLSIIAWARYKCSSKCIYVALITLQEMCQYLMV